MADVLLPDISKKIRKEYLVALVAGGISFFGALLIGLDWLEGAAVLVFFFSLALLIQRVGNIIPVKELAFFFASLQWLLGPVMSYNSSNPHYKYYMYVDKVVYMPFAIYGVLAFGLGLFLFDNKKQYLLRPYFLDKIVETIESQPKAPFFLIVAGLVFSLLVGIVPSQMKFAFVLLADLKYIGIIYLLFSADSRKWFFLFLTVAVTFLVSLNTAMFHGFVLWALFLGMYVLVIKKTGILKKLIMCFVAALLVGSILIVKGELRKELWTEKGYSGSKVALFLNTLEGKVGGAKESEGESPLAGGIINRINQGWIISRIMFYIPKTEPYLLGDSIRKAVYASIIPRFLDPAKQKAGGQDYFERFTGFELVGVSMGPSLLGEGYANFGTAGAIVFVFIMGAVYCFMINWIYRIAVKHPTLLLWLPWIFFHVVKAESDLIRVLNYLVKAMILFFILSWILRRVFKYRL